MKTTTAEVINLEEVRSTKSDGSDGGNDHFIPMQIGTIFCCSPNGRYTSEVDEYQLCAKQGLTVLLLNATTERFERHIGNKFWKQNTMVQVLHVPEEEKQERNNDG